MSISSPICVAASHRLQIQFHRRRKPHMSDSPVVPGVQRRKSSQASRFGYKMRCGSWNVVQMCIEWNDCQRGCFDFQFCLPPRAGPPVAKAPPSRAFPHLPPASQTLPVSPSPDPPRTRFISNLKGLHSTNETLPDGESRGVRCQGWDPGLQARPKLGCP